MNTVDVDDVAAARRSSDGFGQVAVGVLLLVLGSIWLADTVDLIRLRAAIVLPGLLAATGLAIMIASVRGPHPGLMTLGVFLTVATVFASLAPPEAIRGGIGQRRHHVESQTELDSRYELGLGDMTLDLGGLELIEDEQVSVTMGAGDLLVILPPDLAVDIEASAAAGELILLGDQVDGVSLEQSFRSDGLDEAPVRLELELEIGAGRIEVTQ